MEEEAKKAESSQTRQDENLKDDRNSAHEGDASAKEGEEEEKKKKKVSSAPSNNLLSPCIDRFSFYDERDMHGLVL